MTKEEKKFIRDLENECNRISWDICEGKTNGIGEIEAIAFKLAKLRGYEGD